MADTVKDLVTSKRFVVAVTLLALVLARRFLRESDNDGRVAVSGSVNYNGTPREEGTISIAPVAGTDGVSAGGRIDLGRFRIPASKGPKIGTYTIRVTVGFPQSPLRTKDDPLFERAPSFNVT